jgi:hypothetical protein
MDLMKAIDLIMAGILALAVVDGQMLVSPLF